MKKLLVPLALAALYVVGCRSTPRLVRHERVVTVLPLGGTISDAALYEKGGHTFTKGQDGVFHEVK